MKQLILGGFEYLIKTIIVEQNTIIFIWLSNRGHRFICCFRFKLWWMTQRMGSCGKDIPLETQFMLVESKETSEGESETQTIYTVFLPLPEGQFRAVLQGNDKNELEICLESGEFSRFLKLNFSHYIITDRQTLNVDPIIYLFPIRAQSLYI